VTIASNPNALAATCRRLLPLNPPTLGGPRRQHLAAKHCEVALLNFVEAGVKGFGRLGDGLNFGGAPTHTAGDGVETFDGDMRSRFCIVSRMSSVRAFSALRTASSKASQSGY
jgi:hypothetical protein